MKFIKFEIKTNDFTMAYIVSSKTIFFICIFISSEDQLMTKEESSKPITPPASPIDEGRYLLRPASPKQTSSDRKASNSSSGDENASTGKGARKGSIYEQKQIEAPVATKGNRITARTEHLFKQYERDIAVHEPKQLADINNSTLSPCPTESDTRVASPTSEEKRKIDIAREAKERELAEVRQMYQKRLEEEEKLEAEERLRRRQNEELKYRKDLGKCNHGYLTYKRFSLIIKKCLLYFFVDI